ncbi:zinc finger CW-type PWWP domain protein 1-like [Chanos chanos]|uniref:Zinc finger CW-type PWWP domain protein 1-like n=1 Tax=Chanos chanos TaxID=29144 RepID=A0A6J2VF95_CHACN|nr:zinc finger CW-type PWWP domain protein 1-like [Chanos chanos]
MFAPPVTRPCHAEVQKFTLGQGGEKTKLTESEEGREEVFKPAKVGKSVDDVLWVQCSRAVCGKWRQLKDNEDPSALHLDWTCDKNTDPEYSSCSAPEERYCTSLEETFFCKLVPGSLVWAQQNGYPWWPAMVERDPDSNEYLLFKKETDQTPYKCHVTYLGTPVSRAWVLYNRVKDYAGLTEETLLNTVKQERLKKSLKESICMARQAVELSLKRRLARFGFWARHVSDRESSDEDSSIAAEENEDQTVPESIVEMSPDLTPASRDEDGESVEKKIRRGQDGGQPGEGKSADRCAFVYTADYEPASPLKNELCDYPLSPLPSVQSRYGYSAGRIVLPVKSRNHHCDEELLIHSATQGRARIRMV